MNSGFVGLDGQPSIEVAIDLGLVNHLAVKRFVETSRGLCRMLPKVVEATLMGEPGHVIDGISQGLDWRAVIDGGEADGAVDDNHSPRMFQ